MIKYQLPVFSAHYNKSLVNQWQVRYKKHKISVDLDGLTAMPDTIKSITIDGIKYEGGKLRNVPSNIYNLVENELFRIRKKLWHADKERDVFEDLNGKTIGFGWIFKPIKEGSEILKGECYDPDYAEEAM